MAILFVFGMVVGMVTHVSTHHQQMTAEHQHHEHGKRYPFADSEQWQNEDQQHGQAATDQHMEEMFHALRLAFHSRSVL
ncbi:MAG: hypothetical protein CL608_18235 [Anaerolineaceae bacterium]|nr:hypothetical protein [Anaerolineaceae bacterium]